MKGYAYGIIAPGERPSLDWLAGTSYFAIDRLLDGLLHSAERAFASSDTIPACFCFEMDHSSRPTLE